MYEDRTGVLWIGTELGINYFDLLKQNFNHYQTGNSTINNISGNIVWSIFQDENRLIWIGTNEGLDHPGQGKQCLQFVSSINFSRW